MIEMNESKEFNTFFIELQSKIDQHMHKNFPTLPDEKIACTQGKKYIKVTKGNSVYAFINRENGDVLKPAGWKAPAKHARGNIFAEDGGLGCCGPYGVASLK